MALKSKDQMKTVIGTADLSLRADPGEAFIIKDIKVYAASATYVTLKTEKTTVCYFRVDATYGNPLAFPQQRDTAEAIAVPFLKNLLELLLELGIFKGYPVAEGETFLLQGANAATDIKVVIYDIYEPEDVKNTDPNGSLSSEYTLINYGDTGAAIAAAGDHLYDNPLNPAEFPSFPFGTDVPAKLDILLHGICASEVGVINVTPALAIHT